MRDAWLRPLDAQAFVREHWGRRALVFRPESDLQHDPVWDGAYADLESLHPVDAASREGGRHVLTRIVRSAIRDVLREGHTVCGDISRYEPVAAWLDHAQRELGLGPGGFAKLYVSPPGKGFPLHFDPHHVFVLQCRGSKRWWYSDTSAVRNASEPARIDAEGRPVFSGRYDGVHVVSDEGPISEPGTLTEVTLAPGDALYLPPGTWHRAEAIDESVAVSLSPPRLHAFDLVMRRLQGNALRRSAWFEDLAALGENPEAIHQHLARTLREMADSLAEAEVETLVTQRVLRIAEGQRLEDDSLAQVERTTMLERTSAIPRRTLDDRIVFYGGGQEWALPLEARPFVDTLVATGPFRAESVLQWDPSLSWEDAQALLRQLRAAGVLKNAD